MRDHRRFALFDVTYAGQPMPGATVDTWLDDRDRSWWIARVTSPACPIAGGLLRGRTASGDRVCARVDAVDDQPGAAAHRHRVCELRGHGRLDPDRAPD